MEPWAKEGIFCVWMENVCGIFYVFYFFIVFYFLVSFVAQGVTSIEYTEDKNIKEVGNVLFVLLTKITNFINKIYFSIQCVSEMKLHECFNSAKEAQRLIPVSFFVEPMTHETFSYTSFPLWKSFSSLMMKKTCLPKEIKLNLPWNYSKDTQVHVFFHYNYLHCGCCCNTHSFVISYKKIIAPQFSIKLNINKSTLTTAS